MAGISAAWPVFYCNLAEAGILKINNVS